MCSVFFKDVVVFGIGIAKYRGVRIGIYKMHIYSRGTHDGRRLFIFLLRNT